MPQDFLRISVDPKARLRLLEQIDLLVLSPEAKRRVVRNIAMQVRALSRKNVREQRSLDGGPFAPRKRKKNGSPRRRQNKRMLTGLARIMSVDADRVGQGRVSWRNTYTAKIADKHQHGKQERYGGRGGASDDKDFYSAKKRCDRWIARDLLRLGYRKEERMANGRTRRQRVSQRWIMEHMRQDEAVKLWLDLTGYEPKDGWEIGVPARPFLGVNPDQADEILDRMAREAAAKLRKQGKI